MPQARQLLQENRRNVAPAKPPPLVKPASRQPKHGARTGAEKAARDARIAEEMRSNLRKRKAQQRARRAKGEPG
jgi:hypothetical protein